MYDTIEDGMPLSVHQTHRNFRAITPNSAPEETIFYLYIDRPPQIYMAAWSAYKKMAPTPMSETTPHTEFLATGCLQFLNSCALSLEK